MRRRHLLGAGAGLLPSLLAGCTDGSDGSDGDEGAGATTTAPPTADPGDLRGVYVQPFREQTARIGRTSAGPYELLVTAAVPHSFWTVTNAEATENSRTDDHDLHLMVTVWDSETETQVPEVGVDVEIARDGELVSQETIYEMLSQRMGYHYGGNFGLDGDGEYTVDVRLGGTAARTTGAFDGRFDEGASATVTLPFEDAFRDQLAARDLEQSGQPGAVEPMSMGGMPVGVAPAPDAFPGRVRTQTPDGDPLRSNDCEFVVATLPDGGSIADDAYLAVSARTRYNGLVVPSMALSGTVERDGETVAEPTFDRTLEPGLDYHYGATVPDASEGDRLTIAVDTPPQVARHEGYEEAFLRMPPVTVEL
jgi:hypothetical protein